MRNQLKTFVLLGTLSALLVGAGSLLGPGWLWGSLLMAAVMNLGAYFFSDKLVLKMHRAKPLDRQEAPQLHQMLEELSQRAGIPVPKLYLMDEPQPNAFATGRDPQRGVVAVTSGLLRLLTPREIRGVIAHELAHIKNRDILVSTIAAMFAASLTYLAHAASMLPFFQSGDDEDGPSAAQGLLIALVAPIAGMLIQMGISRSREYLADQTGAEISGDPESLAMALEKLERGAEALPNPDAQPATASLFIVSPFATTQNVMQLFSTHPPIVERCRRLRAFRAPAAGVVMPRGLGQPSPFGE